MSSIPPFTSPPISDADVEWITALLNLPPHAFAGASNDDPRLEALKSYRIMDVEACPGSGKTTLLVAKLGALSRHWQDTTRGICVLSHTNVARHEIEAGLGTTSEGQRLMGYPHFVGTIRWSALPIGMRKSLEQSGRDQNVLRVMSNDFSVGDISWSGGTLGREKPLYQSMITACKSTSEQGFFCYEEMFVWANELLDNYAHIAHALRYRFPLLFIDEVQDNSEAQSALLHRIFVEGISPVIRQRFGDMNQAIFGYTGQDGAATDTFPARAVMWPIPNSHRFGQQIADFANPFAIVPQGLVGHGPSGTLIRADTAGKHTIFLFDDASLPFVMDAYANYLGEIFTGDELRDDTFTAVGAVHKRGEDTNRPRAVGHYWSNYDPELTSSDPKPATFFQCISFARRRARENGEAHEAIHVIAEATLRLARLIDPLEVPSSRRRCHLQVLELLKDNSEAAAKYRQFQTRVAINNPMPEQDEWNRAHGPALRSIAEAISRGRSSAASDSFLQYPAAAPSEAPSGARDNVFRRDSAKGLVKIRVGSIHSVKGETYTATLVLDTFFFKQNFANVTRLKQHYVAMTRPTHLLCLAIKGSTFSPAEQAVLRARGWRLAQVGASGTTWI